MSAHVMRLHIRTCTGTQVRVHVKVVISEQGGALYQCPGQSPGCYIVLELCQLIPLGKTE